jgi:RimJ/RimL family protein N-acetyltransferase
VTSTAPEVRLRAVEPDDVSYFLIQQSDAEAIWLAAFATAEPPAPEAFAEKWARILADPANRNRTVVADGQIAGYVSSFPQMGQPSVSYWIGRAWWGRGVATSALAAFLAELDERPLFARVVKDNFGSLRVLEKNGFRICGEDGGFAPARGADVDEWILTLD